MTIYREGETDQITKDALASLDEHREKVAQASKILLSDELPPFLAMRQATQILGSRKEAEELKQRISPKK